MARADRAVVALATLLLAGVTLMWVLLLPPFRPADEAPYVSTVMRMSLGGGYPEPGTVLLDEGVRASYDALGHSAPGSGRPVGPLTPRLSGPPPSWAELRVEGWELDPIFDHDQMSQHPPLWAVWLSSVARALHLDDARSDHALLALRLGSALPILLLPWLVMRSAFAVGMTRPTAWVAAVVPAGWPRLTEVTAGVSNTPLTIITCTVVIWLALRSSRGWLGVVPGLATGLALGLALLTKGLAFATIPTVALALLMAARGNPRAAVLRHLLAVVAASMTGLWWWLRNLARLGTLQPNGFTDEQNTALNDSGRDLRAVVVDLPFGISRDLWIQPMGDTVLTDVLHLGISATVTVLAGVLLLTTLGGPPAVRARLALCLLPVPTVILMTAWGALSGAPGVGVSVVAHGRYVIVAACGVALVAGAGAALVLGRRVWIVPVLLLVVGVLALAIEQSNLWSGDTVLDRVDTMAQWWGLPGWLTWLSAGTALMAALLVALRLRAVESASPTSATVRRSPTRQSRG